MPTIKALLYCTKESGLSLIPFDYNEVIMKEYIHLLQEKNYFISHMASKVRE